MKNISRIYVKNMSGGMFPGPIRYMVSPLTGFDHRLHSLSEAQIVVYVINIESI